ATNGNGVPVARTRINAEVNCNFAKRSQHERKELIPKMIMCATPPLLLGQWKQKVILRNKTGMSARSSPPKMKMWDQEELLRCWVEQRNHKSDFGKTNPILPQTQETKT